ncbi:MAG: YhjD/YihY/BrkB family envelope integrity protein, partial [Acidimicrobiales bacterium]
MLERLLCPLARRWRWVETVLRVQKRYDEVHGNDLGAAMTLNAFLSLFPLLLALVGVVGLVSSNATDLPGTVIEKLGIKDPTSTELLREAFTTAEDSGKAASVIGVTGLLWSGLGLVAALQFALDSVWQAPGRGLKDKVYGLAWLAGASVLFLSSFAVTFLLGRLPGPAWPVAMVGNLVVNVPLWLWTFHALTNRHVGWKPLLP